MNRRVDILKHTILRRRFGGSFAQWFLNCSAPTCDVLARRRIESVQPVGDFVKVKLRGIPGHLFFDSLLSLHDLYQSLAEQLYNWNWHYYQIPQTRIESGDVVFDCGCAEGIFSFLNHQRAEHIYAFEPLPEFCVGLRRTFEGIRNVTIVNSALGAEDRECFLRKEGARSCVVYERSESSVRMETVDRFCDSNNVSPSYIKADLEGYELNVLQGAVDTIARCKPKIVITTYHIGPTMIRPLESIYYA